MKVHAGCVINIVAMSAPCWLTNSRMVSVDITFNFYTHRLLAVGHAVCRGVPVAGFSEHNTITEACESVYTDV